MADNLLTIFEKYPNSWRVDHPDFGDVCKTTFAKGVVTAFYAANNDNPLVVKDICDLTIDGQEFKEVPVFYHSPKDYIENWKQNALQTGHWKDSGVLVDAQGEPVTDIPKDGLPFEDQVIARAAYSFAVDDEVAVMMQEGEPVLVLGLATKPPRKPLDYVKIDGTGYRLDGDASASQTTPETPYTFQISNPGVGSATLFGPDGKALILDKEAKKLPDKRQSQSPTGEPAFEFWLNYACFYGLGGFDTTLGNPRIITDSLGGQGYAMRNIELTGANWDPPAAPAFGPFYGYMNFGFDSPWADYLAAWLNICDTKHTGSGDTELWPGVYRAPAYTEFVGGRPLFWAFAVFEAPAGTRTEEYVLQNWLLEIGPKLYIVRTMYQKTRSQGGGKFHLWKNRIIWPWNGFVAPDDWSGYPPGGRNLWTAPMWMNGPNPWPETIEDCVPPPDDVLDGSYDRTDQTQDFPYFVYSAPSSKKILDNIDSLVEASNAGIDLVELSGSGSGTVKPPEGFKEETPCEENNWTAGVTLNIPSGFFSFDYSKIKFMLSAPVH